MHRLVVLILALVPCVAASAEQPTHEGMPRVRVTTSDELGVRVEDRAALAVDIDKVVVPSLYLWGASEVSLTFAGEPRRVRTVIEAPGLHVCMILFEPPIPQEAVPEMTASLDLQDLGTFLTHRSGDLPVGGSEAVRVIWFQRSLACVTMDVTHTDGATVGSEFFTSDGRVAGLFAYPAMFQVGQGNTMQLCPAFTLRDYVALIEDDDPPQAITFSLPDGRSPGDQRAPVVAELTRLLLSAEASIDDVARAAAAWTLNDADWTTRLPHELYFGLVTIAMKHQLGELQAQLLRNPPELSKGDAERRGIAAAVFLVRRGQVANGISLLESIVEEEGAVMPVACIILAEIHRQMEGDASQATAMGYLRLAIEEYKVDPRAYELCAHICAASRDTEGYIEFSRVWQQTDYSVASSLEPAEQLLAWGKYEEAVEFATTGVERWPDDLDSREALIAALVKRGDAGSARQHFDELRRLSPERATSLLSSDPSLGVIEDER